MGYYKLYRQAPQGKAIHGTLYYCQDGGIGKTFLVRAASTLENVQYAIPALIYRVAVTMSPRFGKLLPILYNVPRKIGSPTGASDSASGGESEQPRGANAAKRQSFSEGAEREGIRIHGGIKPEHSRGCILLNRRAEYKAVVERLLYEQSRNEEIRIEIIDFKPGDPAEPQNIIPLKYTSYESIATKEICTPAA